MATYTANFNSVDDSLAARIGRYEDGAFRDLFREFGQRMFFTAMKILKNEESAKDAVQETMINIHRAADSFRGEAKLATWINRITVNVCLEMIRKNKKHKNRTWNDVSEHIGLEDRRSKNPFREAQKREARDRVRAALAELTEKHEAVVRMHDIEGFTIREIAEHLEVPEGTIKSRLFYGREELKKVLLARSSHRAA